MIVFKLAFRNIIRNGNKSLTIGTLIALGIALMFVGNSIFEGTDRGIRRSFVDSFTADVSVSAVSDESFSIFGNETPVIGELATVPTIVSYDSVSKIVAGSPGVAGTASVVSGLIGIQVRDIQQAVPVFGVDGASYFSCFPGVTLVKGALLSGTAPGAMITEVRAQELEKASGKPLEIGEPIQATVMTSKGFQIREVPLVGIYRYPVNNDALDKIVLLDVTTLRSLYDLTLGVDSSAMATSAQTGLLDKSVNDLFDSSDSAVVSSPSLKLSEVEKNLQDTSKRNELLKVDTGAWDFMLIRLAPGVNQTRFIHSLQGKLTAAGLSVKVGDWRHTAGNSALFIYWLSIIFNIGFGVIVIAGTIIIINTLVIMVLERTGEIGTMRAIGASSGFVRALLVSETMILAIVSGIVGTVIGALVVELLAVRGIRISNQLLVSLFGTTVLRPGVSSSGIFRHIGVAVVIGAISSFYPVRLALKVPPVRAIATE